MTLISRTIKIHTLVKLGTNLVLIKVDTILNHLLMMVLYLMALILLNTTLRVLIKMEIIKMVENTTNVVVIEMVQEILANPMFPVKKMLVLLIGG
jgi:hypothetical protein